MRVSTRCLHHNERDDCAFLKHETNSTVDTSLRFLVDSECPPMLTRTLRLDSRQIERVNAQIVSYPARDEALITLHILDAELDEAKLGSPHKTERIVRYGLRIGRRASVLAEYVRRRAMTTSCDCDAARETVVRERNRDLASDAEPAQRIVNYRPNADVDHISVTGD